jgi:hypothetical protein
MSPINARRPGDAGGPGGAWLEAGTGREAGGERLPGPAGALVLKLVIAATDPLTGTVELPGQAPGISFNGWIDLMSAVSALAASDGGHPDRAS